MHKSGTYNLQKDDKNSYRSFICGLLVVLALCLALYLMMMLIRPNEENELKEIIEENKKGSKDKLTAINVPDEKDKFSTVHEQTTSSYGKNTEQITHKQATNRNRTKEEDLENDILHEIHNTTETPTTRYHTTSTQSIPVKTAVEQTTKKSISTFGVTNTTVKYQATTNSTTLGQTTERQGTNESLETTIKGQTTSTRATPKQTTLVQTILVQTVTDPTTEKSKNGTVNTGKYINDRETTISVTSESDITTSTSVPVSKSNTDTIGSIGTHSSSMIAIMTSTDSINTRTDQSLIHETSSTEVSIKSTEEQTPVEDISSSVTPNSVNENNGTSTSIFNTWFKDKQTKIMESIFNEDNVTTTDRPFTLELSTDTVDLGIDHEIFHVGDETTSTEDSSTTESTSNGSLFLTKMVTSALSTSKAPLYQVTTTTESQTSSGTESYSDSTKLNTKTQNPLFNIVNNSSITTVVDPSDITITTLKTTEVNTITPIFLKNIITTEENEISTVPTVLTTNSESTDVTHLSSSQISTTQTPSTQTTSTQRSKVFYFNTTARTTTQQTTHTVGDESTLTTTSSTRIKAYRKLFKNPIAKEPVCDSATCKKTISKMLNLMNHAIDPCDNFYEFACGGQNNEEEFLAKANFDLLFEYIQKIDNSSQKYLQNFKDFYQSCVEYEADFNFFERIKLMDDVIYFNLTDLFVELILTQSMPFFDIGMDIDHFQNYTIQITLPDQSFLRTGISGWSIFEKIKQECLNDKLYSIENPKINLYELNVLFKQCQRKRLRNAVNSFVHTMMVHFPNSSLYNKENLRKFLKFIDEVQDFYPNYFDIQEELLNKNYKEFDFAELGNFYKHVDWRALFERIIDNIGFKYDYKIQIYFSVSIYDLFLKLNQYKESDVINILWLFSKLQLYENVVMPRERENREMYCMELSKELMPDIVSIIAYEITRRDKSHHIQNLRIHALFYSLKENMKKSLEDSQLTESSKISLEDKVDRLKLGIITTGDYNVTKKNYKSIDLSGDSYPEGVIKLLKNYRTLIYSLEGTKASAASLLTYFVGHFYSQPVSLYQSDFIVFHPAVFQKSPMDLPDYMRLSKIGLHLSREIAKHFYFKASHYQTDTELWQNEIYYKSLKKRTNQLLTDVYAKGDYRFDGKYLNFQVNESLSILNEMMTDNSAFRLIYDSFGTLKNLINLPWISQSYSAEKVFFISAAQEYCTKSTVLDFMDEIYQEKHLPASLRIQNIISNSKEFSDVFACPEGSTMKLDPSLIIQFPYGEFSTDYSTEDYSDYYSNSFSKIN